MTAQQKKIAEEILRDNNLEELKSILTKDAYNLVLESIELYHAAMQNNDSVKFAEWIGYENWQQLIMGEWHRYEKGKKREEATTTQLYEIYKKHPRGQEAN